MKRVLARLARALGVLMAGSAMLGLAGFGALAWQVDQFGQHDSARPADAIVVLGARVEANGQPGSDLASRTRHAVALWRAGYAPNIICSGGFKNERLSAAAVCRSLAIREGVPADQIWLADGTANTAEDADAAAAVMAANAWRSAIVVSHPLHLFRARWFFERSGLHVMTSPTTTETDRIFLPLRAWYAAREAGSLIVTTLDSWGWLPTTVRMQLEIWRLNLP